MTVVRMNVATWHRARGAFLAMNTPQPRLRTKRLTLRPATSGDLTQLHALWSLPDVRRFLFDDQDVSLELATSVLGACLECSPSGYGLWLVHLAEGSELLGCVGLLPTQTAVEHEPALAGLLEAIASFAPIHWHRGYAHEALVAVVHHAFTTLEQSTLAAVNDVPNVASERMLRRLGFGVLSEVQGPKLPLRTYTLQRAAWSDAREHHDPSL
jgi:ribosomal-protein-alanine N-acetyltransferase